MSRLLDIALRFGSAVVSSQPLDPLIDAEFRCSGHAPPEAPPLLCSACRIPCPIHRDSGYEYRVRSVWEGARDHVALLLVWTHVTDGGGSAGQIPIVCRIRGERVDRVDFHPHWTRAVAAAGGS